MDQLISSLKPSPNFMGQRIGIVAANTIGYVEAMFACLEAGNVAVPLRTVQDEYRIQAANVQAIVAPAASEAWMSRQFQPSETLTDPALLAFTSGTEGNPKGVVLSHRNLASVVQRLNTLMQVDGTIREYVGVPVFHSFGFGRCRAVATAGGSFFIPPHGFNPAEIGAMLQAGTINAISAVPSLWRVLLSNPEAIGSYGQRVRWIEIGSQYMSRSEKEALKALFPEARIVQHYGLTEASRSTLLTIHDTEGERLESVGQAIADVEVMLTTEGLIAIKGAHVAQHYLINGDYVELQNEAGWFVTKDLGRLENGYLYYEGRADDVINCGGLKVHPETLETKVFEQLGQTPEFAICRKPDALRGDGFLVAITPATTVEPQVLREAVFRATLEIGVNAANAITVVQVDSLPKTASGKVQRRKLAEWYVTHNAPDLAASDPEEDSPSTTQSEIRAAFCRTLHRHQIHDDDTFLTLGGDSLSYVQLAMELDKLLGKLPEDWETQAVVALEQLQPSHQRAIAPLETSIFFRALAILGVVVNHSNLIPNGRIGGGAMLLLLIAGTNFARFQSPALLDGRVVQTALSLLKNLVIPYWFIAIAYALATGKFDLSVLLLVSNLVRIDVPSLFPVWFIELLVQLILIFSALFVIPPVRKFAQKNAWAFGLGVVICSLIADILLTAVWDTNYLFERVPHKLLWLFAIGWTIHFAHTRSQKMICTIALMIPLAIVFGVSSAGAWLFIGGMMMIWQKAIPVPKPLKKPIQAIGAAAYYIYLTHMIFIHFVLKLPAGFNSPLVQIIVAVIGGGLCWMIPQLLYSWYLTNVQKREMTRSKLQTSI